MFEGQQKMSSSSPDTPLFGTVLLVEDNLIIAMDAEDMLLELGAEQVVHAMSVTKAMHLIETVDVTFAMLDIFLKDETSEAIADKLSEMNVPFIFASGGHATKAHDFTLGVPAVTKPFSLQSMSAAIVARVG